MTWQCSQNHHNLLQVLISSLGPRYIIYTCTKSVHEALQDVNANCNLGLPVTLRSWYSPCPTRILPLMRFDTSLCTVLKSGAEYEEQGQNLNGPFLLYYTTGTLAFGGHKHNTKSSVPKVRYIVLWYLDIWYVSQYPLGSALPKVPSSIRNWL